LGRYLDTIGRLFHKTSGHTALLAILTEKSMARRRRIIRDAFNKNNATCKP
jgi:hypothetical protein